MDGAFGGGGGGILPYKRLMGMCRWTGLHFSFSIELLESENVRPAHFRIFGVRKFFTYTVSKRTRMFVLSVKVKCSSFNLKNIPIHFRMTYIKD